MNGSERVLSPCSPAAINHTVTLPRLGFWPAMVGGLTIYMGVVAVIKLALR